VGGWGGISLLSIKHSTIMKQGFIMYQHQALDQSLTLDIRDVH
jgi:hypothetical protein